MSSRYMAVCIQVRRRGLDIVSGDGGVGGS